MEGMWGGVCLALGVLQRCQAVVLPLWQLRGEFKRPPVSLGGGPAQWQAFVIPVLMCSWNGLGLAVTAAGGVGVLPQVTL